MPQPFHKLEMRRLLTTDTVKPRDIVRIESAGDSGYGKQLVLYVDTKGRPWRALIDRPTNKDKAAVQHLSGWDV